MEENVTLVMVTHSAELAARMDQIFRLKNGFLINQQSGLPIR
jgi:predicted ABC-type transport system involved in lysophospholipase L1 biosynthesis ATPase subunit